MRVALDKDFSPANPYSKYLVCKLRFSGPIVDSEWIFHDEVKPFYWQQVITKNLTRDEQKDVVSGIQRRIYEKAISFDSKLLIVKAIDEGLFV